MSFLINYLNEEKIMNNPNISNNSNNLPIFESDISKISNLNNSVTNTPPSQKETIIKFHMDQIENENIKRNSKQFNISPIVRRTPNTKADLIIQKIYSNRRNVIRQFQNSSKKDDLYNITDISSKIKNETNNENVPLIYSQKTKSINENNLYNEENCNSINEQLQAEIQSNEIINKKCDNNNSPSTDKSYEGSSEQSTTPISEMCASSSTESLSNDTIYNKNIDKKKRKYYRTFKLKKSSSILPINIKEIQNQNNQQNTPKTTPSSSPRDISDNLWNDSIENYYLEFQKLCKDESDNYKYLSYRNEIISNFLKFTLLISGCFTFTLSISIPNSLFMSTTTTISSCLTAIITSITGFFQFDKKSEIQYNIYRELDKLYNTISLEMLKPTYMRPDPYELILSLRNRRDELLKTLSKK